MPLKALKRIHQWSLLHQYYSFYTFLSIAYLLVFYVPVVQPEFVQFLKILLKVYSNSDNEQLKKSQSSTRLQDYPTASHVPNGCVHEWAMSTITNFRYKVDLMH